MELPPDVMAELLARYGEPHRAYHTWQHIEALLEFTTAWQESIADPDAMMLAILFHDAVYDPRASDNEERSAELMRQFMAEHASTDALDRAEALILATRTHDLPESTDTTFTKDAALLLDMDLAILGSSPERFHDYDAAIRREYAHVPDEFYIPGRRAVLGEFLKRDRIYHTDAFRHTLEKQARFNLAAAIARLDSGH